MLTTTHDSNRAIGRQWRPQFSMRMLLLFMVLAGLVFAGMSRIRQRERALERLFGRGSISFNIKTPWMDQFGAKHAFSSVTSIRFAEGANDAAARDLWAAAGAKWLEIESDVLTDEGLENVHQMKNLMELDLNAPLITDNGIRCLRDLRSLKKLKIRGATIGDEGIRYLACLSSLEDLTLLDCCMDDARLAPLGSLRQLTKLDLCDSSINDRSLENLHGFPALSELHLSGTNVGDASMTQVAALKKLRIVSFNYTAVTDKALTALACHAEMRSISAFHSQITSAGAEDFRRCCTRRVAFSRACGLYDPEGIVLKYSD